MTKEPVRIILADDHAILRAGLKAFLQESPDPAITVLADIPNGREALLLAESLRPDLLIMDLAMPEMGGLETTIELRRRGLPIRILILTQYSESVYLQRLLEAGANGYVLKSARGDELLSAIRSILSGGTYVDPALAASLVSKAIGRADGTAAPDGLRDEELYQRLSQRERQILKLVSEGLSNKEIANSLDLSVKTVMAHRMNLMDKLGIHNRSKLIQFAIRLGLLPVGAGSQDPA